MLMLRINLYDLEKRFIYFISDGPHLIRISRDCLSDCDAGRHIRPYMSNYGMFII